MIEKPPSSKVSMGIGSRAFPTNNPLVRRLANNWTLWNSDWGICPIRVALHNRCYSILMDF